MQTILSYNTRHREHSQNGHVERPERLDAVMARLEKRSIWREVRRINADAVGEDDLLLVHDMSHVHRLRHAADQGLTHLDGDTYLTPSSYAVALDAVGCVLAATREIVEGRARNGFAAIRPPGHHATPSRAMGFCLFSNAAIAARWALHHAGVGRVLIIDFDVHHGNGTQDVFYEDDSVAYVSVHQSPFYPGTGAASDQGHGAGLGTTLNMPLPSGMGDDSYLRITQSILRPFALAFDPDLILISAGYDAHWRDPLGGMRLTVDGFAIMVREIMSCAEACCDGRLVAVLEGGYDTEALAACVAATIETLCDPDSHVDDPLGSPPGRDLEAEDYLADLESYHATDVGGRQGQDD